MRKITIIKSIIITLGVIFAISTIININRNFDAEINNKSSEYSDDINIDDENLKISKVSGKIHIIGNSGWVDFKNAENCTGSGTYSDPYVIDDLVIDGKGLGSCIWIENSSVYFKIENCTLCNSGGDWFDAGIKLQLVSNGVLFNNTVNNNDEVGIYLSDSNNNTISGNTANNNDWWGIYVAGSINNISGNTASYNGNYGIIIQGSDNNISGNIANYNYGDGIFLEGSNNTVSGNALNNNNWYGIYLYYSDYNMISGNIMNDCALKISGGFEELCSHEIDTTNLVNGKPLYYYTNELNLGTNNFTNAGQVILINCSDSLISNLNVSYSGGISLHYCKKNTLSNNTVNNNNGDGIFLSGSDNNTVSGNNANNNEYSGITLGVSNNNILSGNNVSYNGDNGIILGSSYNNTVSGNNAHNNEYSGITLDSSYNNIVLGNNANNNEYSGITLGFSNNNILSENTANNNGFCGIAFFHCDYNIISETTVKNNTYGIGLYDCDYNLISGNIINDNSIGIILIDSNYNYVVKNSFRDNSMDIVEENCEGNYFGYNINPFEIVMLMILIPIIITTITTGILILTKRYVKHQSERERKDRTERRETIEAIEEIKAKDLVNGKMSDNKVIVVKGLKKYFGKVKAVNGISFDVRQGEVFCLLGPNGAGKTTTIKLLLGFLVPNGGEMSVLGLNPELDDVQIKQRVGYVSEEPLKFKALTPKDLFNFIASIRGLDKNTTVKLIKEYLESFEINEFYDQLIASLSHGNKQKLQIIISILHQPDLLILDEPIAGLDPKSVKIVKSILKLHTQKGGSVLLSTHIMEIAEELCDRIGILHKGEMVGIGTMEELCQQADKIGANLENVFLRLTEQDTSVNEILKKLREFFKKKS